ncbi:hypothetical protein J6590_068615 [Homalodisca vitripennis]|nr:hypothetical protein J6590_068615 [Homalodisca vitripennis]
MSAQIARLRRRNRSAKKRGPKSWPRGMPDRAGLHLRPRDHVIRAFALSVQPVTTSANYTVPTAAALRPAVVFVQQIGDYVLVPQRGSNALRGDFDLVPQRDSDALRGDFDLVPQRDSDALRGDFGLVPQRDSDALRGDFDLVPQRDSDALRRDFGLVPQRDSDALRGDFDLVAQRDSDALRGDFDLVPQRDSDALRGDFDLVPQRDEAGLGTEGTERLFGGGCSGGTDLFDNNGVGIVGRHIVISHS